MRGKYYVCVILLTSCVLVQFVTHVLYSTCIVGTVAFMLSKQLLTFW